LVREGDRIILVAVLAEIVGGRSQDEEPLNQTATTMPGLAQAADGFHPAERFFVGPLAAWNGGKVSQLLIVSEFVI
jgi:hypothetical protein